MLASTITLRAGRDDQAVALAVQDDGTGFTPGDRPARSGHGLGNMQARVQILGGQFQCMSTPGNGTRIVVNMPAPVIATA